MELAANVFDISNAQPLWKFKKIKEKQVIKN
jgi:hypothetical protein